MPDNPMLIRNFYGLPPPPPPPPPPEEGEVVAVVSAEITLPPMFDERALRKYLNEQNWPKGLLTQMCESFSEFSLRYFICDNSLRMVVDPMTQAIEGGSTR